MEALDDIGQLLLKLLGQIRGDLDRELEDPSQLFLTSTPWRTRAISPQRPSSRRSGRLAPGHQTPAPAPGRRSCARASPTRASHPSGAAPSASPGGEVPSRLPLSLELPCLP